MVLWPFVSIKAFCSGVADVLEKIGKGTLKSEKLTNMEQVQKDCGVENVFAIVLTVAKCSELLFCALCEVLRQHVDSVEATRAIWMYHFTCFYRSSDILN